MAYILAFRIFMFMIFILAAWRFGDWKNRAKYYPTVLFVMVVNLAASFITYHHALWYYNPDALVRTQTALELINSFVMLPSATFIYLSRHPLTDNGRCFGYMLLWVGIFSSFEYMDKTIGGIAYKNGWSWQISTLFDIAMFSIIRVHYTRPFWAWLACLVITAIILIVFNFESAEMK